MVIKVRKVVTFGSSSQEGYRELWGASNINGTALQYSCLENPMDGGAW